MGATLFHVYSDNSRKPIISAYMDKVELFKEEKVLVSAVNDSYHKNEFMLLKEELSTFVNISELLCISKEDEIVNKVKVILSGNEVWDKRSRNLE
uniref:Uncharacterized protein n=1 Tax=Strongyloides venezuelensis TaxID=75913 RepID=A0A0K0FJ09_STRVS